MIQDILAASGVKFDRRNWPRVPVALLKECGITPKMLQEEYQQASLETSQIGNRPAMGIMLVTGPTTSRPLIPRRT